MLVSILIPCHNAERWIAECIQSALAQTWPEKEVIVVDDGSTDGSLRVIESFGDRIRFETGLNRGGNAARNRLLELARGDWVQYLDADDFLRPRKVETQAVFAAAHPDISLVCSPVVWLWQRDCEEREQVTPIPPPHDDPWVLLARWWLPQTGGTLWRRQALVEAGGWKMDQPCCQEHELYLRLLICGARFHILDECHAVWRDWSATATVSKRDDGELRRRKLDVLDRMEKHLVTNSALSDTRRDAINQTRFELARSTWLTNAPQARCIIRDVLASQPSFQPAPPAATGLYRWLFRVVGFNAAEASASLKRQVTALFRRNRLA